MREAEMAEIAHLVRRVLAAPDDESEREAVREEVAMLCSKFVPYP
jgi:glycine/serine hydroxymethyltransferase